MKNRPREERLITGYLLGEASESEQTQLETLYFRDAQFYELLLALEVELISDYVSGLLPPHKRKQFERHFLKSTRRRQRYETVSKLMDCVARQPALPNDSSASKLATALAIRKRRARQQSYEDKQALDAGLQSR
jgi:hypothetical protein